MDQIQPSVDKRTAYSQRHHVQNVALVLSLDRGQETLDQVFMGFPSRSTSRKKGQSTPQKVEKAENLTPFSPNLTLLCATTASQQVPKHRGHPVGCRQPKPPCPRRTSVSGPTSTETIGRILYTSPVLVPGKTLFLVKTQDLHPPFGSAATQLVRPVHFPVSIHQAMDHPTRRGLRRQTPLYRIPPFLSEY